MSSPSLNFRLEQYEGPLDLLLDLIRKQQINIHDIPIAKITQQYLEYLEQAAALDIELGAEFILMAATLIHIKSKTLLPRDPELEKISPEEDPRKDLVRQLLEHERFKNAAEMLQQKRLVEEAIWSNPQIQNFHDPEDDAGLSVSLFDLVKVFQDVLERAKSRPVYEVEKEDVTVPDMILYLKRLLEDKAQGARLSARQLFEQQKSRRALVCLFLALLELVKRQAISLEQSELFGDIDIAKQKPLEEVFLGEDNLESLEQNYK
ncbi:MAG: segregation/condensation protein A [Bryobacteraceae bacterium]|nr:segregation/condensation protein A [Bryobacteraceae bacterium]MDW8378601.1 segregation/condensation protein A [Bryobacterales bacterium]